MDNLFPNTRTSQLMKMRKKPNVPDNSPEPQRKMKILPPMEIQSGADKVQKFIASMKSAKVSGLLKPKQSGQYSLLQKQSEENCDKYTPVESLTPEIEKKRKFEDNSEQTPDTKKQKKMENNSNCKDKTSIGFAVWEDNADEDEIDENANDSRTSCIDEDTEDNIPGASTETDQEASAFHTAAEPGPAERRRR